MQVPNGEGIGSPGARVKGICASTVVDAGD